MERVEDVMDNKYNIRLIKPVGQQISVIWNIKTSLLVNNNRLEDVKEFTYPASHKRW